MSTAVGALWGIPPYDGPDLTVPSHTKNLLANSLMSSELSSEDRRGLVNALSVVLLVVAYAILILVVWLRRTGLAAATPSATAIATHMQPAMAISEKSDCEPGW